MRTIVDLPEEQLEALKRLCAEQGVSRAEAVRRAVARLLEETAPADADFGFGLWRHKRVSSREFVDRLRGEWAPR